MAPLQKPSENFPMRSSKYGILVREWVCAHEWVCGPLVRPHYTHRACTAPATPPEAPRTWTTNAYSVPSWRSCIRLWVDTPQGNQSTHETPSPLLLDVGLACPARPQIVVPHPPSEADGRAGCAGHLNMIVQGWDGGVLGSTVDAPPPPARLARAHADNQENDGQMGSRA